MPSASPASSTSRPSSPTSPSYTSACPSVESTSRVIPRSGKAWSVSRTFIRGRAPGARRLPRAPDAGCEGRRAACPLGEHPLVVAVEREDHGPVLRHQDVLLEADGLLEPRVARERLDREVHVLLQLGRVVERVR